MSEFNPSTNNSGEDAGPGTYRDSSALNHHRQPATHCNDRLAELELENSRLHRLIAELLIRNQQLRKPD